MDFKKEYILDMKYDKRSNCISILTSMPLRLYEKIARTPYNLGGNIEGQRDVIKKSSAAAKIRKRMETDFAAGAVFPPVVIGIDCSTDQFQKIKNDINQFDPTEFPTEQISIIDGMQRSYIFFTKFDENEDREIRVEFWISDTSVKLLYRMLVLNTGQVPWNTRRQIEVIYANLSCSILNSLYEKNPDLKDQVDIMSIDQEKRRTQAGKFQKDKMIRLFLGYNTRRVKVDVNDQLADEYQRFDMIESIDDSINFDMFVDAFSYLCKLDIAFSQCSDESTNGQFTDGKSIFGSMPACIGFIVACAEFVMGKVSVERTDDEKKSKNEKLNKQILTIVNNLATKRISGEFLALDILNEQIKQLSTSRIGDEMSSLFKQVFSEMLRWEDWKEIPSLDSFWRV